MLVQTSLDVSRNSEVMFARRKAAERIQEILQKILEPLTGIEPVTFRSGRSTIRLAPS
jgi:hypothetical protein